MVYSKAGLLVISVACSISGIPLISGKKKKLSVPVSLLVPETTEPHLSLFALRQCSAIDVSIMPIFTGHTDVE